MDMIQRGERDMSREEGERREGDQKGWLQVKK